jgi:hypothetical protein
MNVSFIYTSRQPRKWRLVLCFTIVTLLAQQVQAHQTPTTIVLLDVSPTKVAMELQLPLSELVLAFGHEVDKDPQHLIQKAGPQLKEYLLAHIHAFVNRDNPWMVAVTDMKVEKAVQMQSGPPFQEITVHLILTPPAGSSTRNFKLDYDVIMHQVVNHAAFVSVRNDWETGKTGEQPVEVGVIRVDTKTTLIYPLEINLERGDWWIGFRSMLALGMQHIKEGTDHLLFLVVLLLPAMLLVNGKRWGGFGGTRYSLLHLLKIVTAFTIGHSITLLVGALGWIRLPTQPVEVLIAASILVSVVHAIRPMFPGKEAYVAAGFGLIHGLAFASVLSDLHLGAGPMALSILGFNIGIELMQLFVILLIVPWLILLSQTSFYTFIRITSAVLAAVAALAWIVERVSGMPNKLAAIVQSAALYAYWGILLLAILGIAAYGWQWNKLRTRQESENTALK